MRYSGDARGRLERTLNAAYGDGLVSQRTLLHRLHMFTDLSWWTRPGS